MKRGKQAIRNCKDLTYLTEEVRLLYERCKLILKELKERVYGTEASELSALPDSFQTQILRAHYLRTYGIGLAITTYFNCMLQALDPNKYTITIEARSLIRDILLHAQQSNVYRPIGAGYVLMCLSAAWSIAADPQLRSMVEVTMIDYHNDFASHNGMNVSRELERVSKNLWLGSTARPKAALSF